MSLRNIRFYLLLKCYVNPIVHVAIFRFNIKSKNTYTVLLTAVNLTISLLTFTTGSLIVSVLTAKSG